MSKEAQNNYMLLFRGNDWHKGLSPEETQTITGNWMAWFKKLTERGQVIGGHPLEAAGKVVSGKNGRVVSDGPFAESKEAVGGYFMLKVNSLDEAVAIAKECPALPYGVKVEVRGVLDECPHMKDGQALAERELATAAA